MKKKAGVIPLTDDPTRPLPPKHAAIVVRKLWREGKVTWREHAARRKDERDFDTLEVEALVLNGVVIGVSGREGNCWRYEIEDRQQTKRLVLAIRRERLEIVTVTRLGRP